MVQGLFNLDGSGSLGPGVHHHHHHHGQSAPPPQVSQGYAGPNGGNGPPSNSTPRSTPGPSGTQMLYHPGNSGNVSVPTSAGGPPQVFYVQNASYSSQGAGQAGSNPGTVPSPGNSQPFMIPHSMPPAPPTQASIYSSVASGPFAPIVTGLCNSRGVFHPHCLSPAL